MASIANQFYTSVEKYLKFNDSGMDVDVLGQSECS